jgi:hypothetical protein
MADQPSPRDAPSPEVDREFAHALLFTGHMIDRPGRKQARFPAAAEDRARRAIHDAIAGVDWNLAGATVGLAGGASGGDLLFHECCEELGIETRVLLALPSKHFEAESVAPAGSEWVARYEALLRKAGSRVKVMQEQDGLLEGPTTNVWQRANLWMMEEAGRLARECALLALWDGRAGDGPGGTEHFIELARMRGIRILPLIRTQSLLAEEKS